MTTRPVLASLWMLAIACALPALPSQSALADPADAAAAATSQPALPPDSADVTDVVAKLVKDNALSVSVDNDTLGIDPAEGFTKKLKITYTIGDQVRTAAWAEGQTATITGPKDAKDGKLIITRAIYGVMRDPVIVTERLVAALQDNAISIAAGNEALGIDPDAGTGKQLVVLFSIDGKLHQEAVSEHDIFAIDKPSGDAKVKIIRATWGPSRKWFDETELVAGAVKDGKLVLVVEDETLGDPSVGDAKQLRIDYTVAGKPSSVTLNQYEVAKLPGEKDGAGPLVINAARYGVLPK